MPSLSHLDFEIDFSEIIYRLFSLNKTIPDQLLFIIIIIFF